MGFSPLLYGDKSYTTPSILKELRFKGLSVYKIESYIKLKSLIVKQPSQNFVQQIDAVCGVLGEQIELSEADRDILALSKELKDSGLETIILTDDFAIQNVAEYLGIQYEALATKGIRNLQDWMIYCPACWKKVENTHLKKCDVCGSRLKRKPIKTRQVRFKRTF